MGLESRLSRLEGLEQLIEERIEARVEQELDAAIHSLEQHLTRQELRRVLEILSAAEEEPKMGQYTKRRCMRRTAKNRSRRRPKKRRSATTEGRGWRGQMPAVPGWLMGAQRRTSRRPGRP